MPTTRTRILLGAAAGLLSAAAGVGASMIVSVVVGGAPTPITAVGARVIDATPGAVKDWAVEHLGTNDKPFLLAGIFSAIAVLAAITGVLAWRSRRAALVLTTILGLVGLAAAYADRTTLVDTAAKVAPAVVALGVSVGFLHLFTRHWTADQQRPKRLVEAPEPLVAVGAGRTAVSAPTVSQAGVATTTAGTPHRRVSTAARFWPLPSPAVRLQPSASARRASSETSGRARETRSPSRRHPTSPPS